MKTRNYKAQKRRKTRKEREIENIRRRVREIGKAA